jgi:DNA-binding transcriptional regulator YdaS (Cro superfamily)
VGVLERALEIVGTQQALAQLLGVSPQAVNQWVTGRRPIPPKRALHIEKLTRGRVTAASLRPDLSEIFSGRGTAKARKGRKRTR